MTRLIVSFAAGVASVFVVECLTALHLAHPYAPVLAGVIATILTYATLRRVTI